MRARPELGVNALDAMLLAFKHQRAAPTTAGRRACARHHRQRRHVAAGHPDHTAARIMVRANHGTTLDESCHASTGVWRVRR